MEKVSKRLRTSGGTTTRYYMYTIGNSCVRYFVLRKWLILRTVLVLKRLAGGEDCAVGNSRVMWRRMVEARVRILHA